MPAFSWLRFCPARNGDIIRGAFIIDSHEREIIAWFPVVNGGISGSDMRGITLASVKARIGHHRAPHQVEMLSDNGSPDIAKDACIVARQLGLNPFLTPVKGRRATEYPKPS